MKKIKIFSALLLGIIYLFSATSCETKIYYKNNQTYEIGYYSTNYRGNICKEPYFLIASDERTIDLEEIKLNLYFAFYNQREINKIKNNNTSEENTNEEDNNLINIEKYLDNYNASINTKLHSFVIRCTSYNYDKDNNIYITSSKIIKTISKEEAINGDYSYSLYGETFIKYKKHEEFILEKELYTENDGILCFELIPYYLVFENNMDDHQERIVPAKWDINFIILKYKKVDNNEIELYFERNDNKNNITRQPLTEYEKLKKYLEY